ncbi:MAG: HEPN domain-containing protein [Paracraurococcus sp.]
MTSDAVAWLRRAESDLDGVRRALMPLPGPNPELAAYHCQQAGEKLVKALLVALGIAFPRRGFTGHDIGLAARLIPDGHALRPVAVALAELTPWATAFRYPTEDPSTAEATPTPEVLAAWLERLEAFRTDVAALTGVS